MELDAIILLQFFASKHLDYRGRALLDYLTLCRSELATVPESAIAGLQTEDSGVLIGPCLMGGRLSGDRPETATQVRHQVPLGGHGHGVGRSGSRRMLDRLLGRLSVQNQIRLNYWGLVGHLWWYV